MTPSEIGASSLEKWRISCGLPLSVSRKFSFSNPVTRRFMGSVIVTGTSTRSTSFLIGLVCVRREGSEIPLGSVVVASVFLASRGVMWISSSLRAGARGASQQASRHMLNTRRMSCECARWIGRTRNKMSRRTISDTGTEWPNRLTRIPLELPRAIGILWACVVNGITGSDGEIASIAPFPQVPQILTCCTSRCDP